MENKATISDIHADLINWVKELVFYKEELKTFQVRLEEVVRRNNHHDILAEVEHFQNQFIRQNEVIDELKHEFKQYDGDVVRNVLNANGSGDQAAVQMPPELLDQHDTFIKLYAEMKSDFEKFLSKTF